MEIGENIIIIAGLIAFLLGSAIIAVPFFIYSALKDVRAEQKKMHDTIKRYLVNIDKSVAIIASSTAE